MNAQRAPGRSRRGDAIDHAVSADPLKLKTNPAKSMVVPMGECAFLGFTIKGKKITLDREIGSELQAPGQGTHGKNADDTACAIQRVVEGARTGQRERPLVKSPGLHGAGVKKSFVERADLVVPPTANPHGGWCGGWGIETPGHPIRPSPASSRPNRAQHVQRHVRLVAFDPAVMRDRRDVKRLPRQEINPLPALIHNDTMPR